MHKIDFFPCHDKTSKSSKLTFDKDFVCRGVGGVCHNVCFIIFYFLLGSLIGSSVRIIPEY